MPLKENIRNFFDIFYTPSGQITTGMSVPVTLRFSPQLNEDINDFLPLLAQSGPINIPLISLCQKAIIKLEKDVIDFGKVIFGENKILKLKLNNIGALETDY